MSSENVLVQVTKVGEEIWSLIYHSGDFVGTADCLYLKCNVQKVKMQMRCI